MRIILIDVYSKEIKKVDIDLNTKNVRELIKCDVFTSVSFNDKYTIYVDDEGLLNGTRSGFTFSKYGTHIMGNGIIVKNGKGGKDIDCDLEIDYVQNNITFIDFDNQPPIPPVIIYSL